MDAQIFFIGAAAAPLATALVGSTLAAAGVVLQALPETPATPFTRGPAGAALGAMLATSCACTCRSGASRPSPVQLCWVAGRRRHRLCAGARSAPGFSTNVLLLAGVTLNSFFSALILFVQYLADPSEALRTMRWLMGDLDVAGYAPILAALPLAAIASAAFVWLPRSLNLLSLDADAAATRGVNVVRVQQVAFFSASVATGAAVSLGGPIGFIGIIVPHLVRLMVGADHRVVLPASALVGAAFLVVCDVLARTVMAPQELPVGIITRQLAGRFPVAAREAEASRLRPLGTPKPSRRKEGVRLRRAKAALNMLIPPAQMLRRLTAVTSILAALLLL